MNDPRFASTDKEGGELPASSPLLNRFWVASLTFLRARQLDGGARPRLEPEGHKRVRVALLEVTSGLVSGEIRGA